MLNNVIIIGFMGSGKTTIGRELAKLCDSILLDSDKIIEINYDMSVSDIFSTHGEEYFRQCEMKFCDFVRNNINNAIIATGGGLPMRYDLRELGRVFYLKAPFSALMDRVKEDNKNQRPLFNDINVAKNLYNKRIKKYEMQADYTLNALDSITENSNKIYSYIKGCE